MSTLSPSTAQPPAIDVSGVSKSFASKSSRPIHALSDISFSIAQGEIVGLLGEVPRVLFLGICLDFYYCLRRVLVPKFGFHFDRGSVSQALVKPRLVPP